MDTERSHEALANILIWRRLVEPAAAGLASLALASAMVPGSSGSWTTVLLSINALVIGSLLTRRAVRGGSAWWSPLIALAGGVMAALLADQEHLTLWQAVLAQGPVIGWLIVNTLENRSRRRMQAGPSNH